MFVIFNIICMQKYKKVNNIRPILNHSKWTIFVELVCGTPSYHFKG